jgi:hypothetical protein
MKGHLMLILKLRSGLSGERLRKALDSLGAVAVRPGVAGAMREFMLAGHLAGRAFQKKANIARQMRFEFLLWLTGRTDIRSAMEAASPDGGEFFVILFPKHGTRNRKPETPDIVCRALEARKLPPGLPEEAEPLALERISLSRIRG